MGICISHLPFFDKCAELGAFLEQVHILSPQDIHDTEKDVAFLCKRNGYNRVKSDPSLKSLLIERWGKTDIVVSDMNDRADVKLDLSKVIPESFVGSAGCVINCGTLEHVSDPMVGFENMHRLCQEGGFMIHVVPITWYNHAGFNINPKLLAMLASANNYILLHEGFHFQRDELNRFFKRRMPKYYTTFSDGGYTENAGSIEEIFKKPLIPSDCLYMALFQKKVDLQFERFYDLAP